MGAAIFLRRDQFGDGGGLVAFLLVVGASWLTGPGPASIASLVLMLASRADQRGLSSIWSQDYTGQEITNLVVFTVIMYTVGWAGAIRRKSLAEVRKREMLLREEAVRKDQFLAILAHELRNPLAPLRNGLEALQHCAGANYDAEVFAEVHSIMTRQLAHMVRLVDDLLDISRINSGKIALQWETLDGRELMREAAQFALPHIEAAGHHLSLKVPDGPFSLRGDRARLIQVLSNLLNNATKFTPAGGKIEFIAALDDACVTFTVNDTGIGLAPKSLTLVFEMFAQVEESVIRKQGGLGIGLNLSKRLVEMHGGQIQAFSAGLGQGSQFIVKLPSLAGELGASKERSNQVDGFSLGREQIQITS